MPEENKALGRREIEEVFNGTDPDAAHEIYASDFADRDRASSSWETPSSGEMREYVGVFRSAFPDFRATLEDQVWPRGTRR